MIKGVVVRHLLLQAHEEDSEAAVKLLHERYGNKVILSLMNQYTPVIDPASAEARKFPNLLVAPTDFEYDMLLDYADDLGIEDYFWQEGGAVDESFIPPFDLTGVLSCQITPSFGRFYSNPMSAICSSLMPKK